MAGQQRVAGMGGVIGLDLGAALRMAEALGYDRRWAAELLPYGEAGLVAALNKNAKQTDDAKQKDEPS